MIQEEIIAALAPLRHTRLTDLGRAGGMQWLVFSSDGLPPFSLHLQCTWQLIAGSETLVDETDIELPASGRERLPERDYIGATRRDERNAEVRVALSSGTRVVGLDIAADASFSIAFANGWRLQCEPAFDPFCEAYEQWRLLAPDLDVPHVVFTSAGFESPEA